jgi:hypothetical protein
MFSTSQLVTHHPTEMPGVFYTDPVLSEREFTRWLTLDQRQIPEGNQDEAGDRVASYDGGLLDEFFATLPARTAFWVKAREEALTKVKARREAVARRHSHAVPPPLVAPFPVGDGETVGTSNIAAYIERLEWVGRRRSDPEFLALNGHHRLWFVAIALSFGIDSATRYLHGDTEDWGEDELQEGVQAFNELEFLIYQQRGSAVEFLPARDRGSA